MGKKVIPLEEFIILLHETLEESGIAYKKYLDGGKTFRFAQELKKHNDRITSLIKENGPMIPSSLLQDTDALLFHYNAWTEKWLELAASMKPGPDDIFVFSNDVTFPKQAAIHIEEEYRSIKSNKD